MENSGSHECQHVERQVCEGGAGMRRDMETWRWERKGLTVKSLASGDLDAQLACLWFGYRSQSSSVSV